MNPVLLKSVRSGLALEKKGLYREAELVYDNILATHLLKDNRAYFIYRKAKARLKSGDCRAAACRSYFGRL